jgi:DNA-binding transcriptional regulator GbsR (MarR family)
MTTSQSSTASSRSEDEPLPRSRYDEAVDRFVAFWGDMATNWGINRSMARVYALLYCANRPLNTDDIMERLQISRGSANMNLRSLVDWAIVEKTTVPGSRKDHYVAETDVWKVTARIIEERERREIQPVKEHLQSVANDLVPDDASPEDCAEADRELYRRLHNLIELMEVFEGVSEALLPLVQNRNEDLVRRLIFVAQSLNREAEGQGETSDSDDE